MPNDARLGLVMGVTLVILVAVLFIRKDGLNGRSPSGNLTPPSSAGSVAPGRLQGGVLSPPGVVGVPPQPIVSRPVTAPGPRMHKVREGETLMSLSQRYYGNTSGISLIFNANRNQLFAPDRIPDGAILVIPEKPAELVAQTHP